MRTTLDIDEDVLQAAEDLASARKMPTGKVLSELARQSLRPAGESPESRNGVPLLSPRLGEKRVTMEMVNRLREQE